MRRVLLLIAVALALVSLRLKANETSGEPLIVGVDMEKLAASLQLGQSKNAASANSTYFLNDVQISVRVYQMQQEAHEALRKNLMSRQVGPTRVKQKFGDEFFYWDGRSMFKTSNTSFAMRRRNVIFDVSGPAARMLPLAGRIDDALLHSDAIAPKGSTVPIPRVELVPQGPAIESERMLFSYTSLDDSPVRLNGWVEPNGSALQKSGEVYFFIHKGQSKIDVTVTSPGNVVGYQEMEIHPITRQQYEDRQPQILWKAPEFKHPDNMRELRRIYFVKNPGDKSHSPFLQEDEYLAVDKGNLGPLRDKAVREQTLQHALRQWSAVLQPQWLPRRELVTLSYEDELSMHRYVAACPFVLKGVGNAILVSRGNECWMYIEQPDPLPKDSMPLDFGKILKLDNGKVTKESYTRYRAYDTRGTFSKVNVWRLRWAN